MSRRGVKGHRAVAAAVIIGAMTFGGMATASADHVHSKKVGNGSCVLLAQNGGEGLVDLPFATDTQVEKNRAHPLHLLVHLGQPGKNFEIGVKGTAPDGTSSDPCVTDENPYPDYLND